MKTWVTSFLITFLVTSSRMAVGFQGDPYSNDGCGETRGCFDCRDNRETCEVNVAWEPNPDGGVVKFTLWGNKIGDQAHVSLGITSTQDMFSADVYSCISDDTGLVLVRSWNPPSGRSTTQATLKGVFGQEVTEVDGEIRCQFYRNMSLNDGDSQFLDISGDNSYYLILARGPAGGGAIFGHDGPNRGLSGAVALSEEFDSSSTTTQGGMDGHTQEDKGVSSPTLPTVSPTQSAPISVRYGAWTLISSLIMALLVNI